MNRVDRAFDIGDQIFEILQMLLLRGILWFFIMLHFSSWVAALLLIALVVGTVLAEMDFWEVGIGIDVFLSILALIALVNMTDKWLYAIAGVALVNVFIRLRVLPF